MHPCRGNPKGQESTLGINTSLPTQNKERASRFLPTNSVGLNDRFEVHENLQPSLCSQGGQRSDPSSTEKETKHQVFFSRRSCVR